MTLDKTSTHRPISDAKPPRSAPTEDDGRDDELDDASSGGLHRAAQMATSWVASGVFHMMLLIVLALVPLLSAHQSQHQILVAAASDDTPPPAPPKPEDTKIDAAELDLPRDVIELPMPLDTDPNEPFKPEPIDKPTSGPEVDNLLGLPTRPGYDGITKGIDPGEGHPYDRREHPERWSTPEEIAAVSAALRWLAAHQLPGGDWSFDHRQGACQGRCGNHGSLADARLGATALGVLPFLAYGHTHHKGKYKQVVRKALVYLARGMKQNGSLHESGGTMYSHGLAAIALCEAYAMTGDRELFVPAQRALDFISAAQDPVGGGWRYHPKQAGDTSVVGWQIMALKSGHLSHLTVDPNTIRGAEKFLDSVQSESGAFYGYTSPGKSSATTAIGLLCRMYIGWKHDNPALERGVAFLSKTGPSKSNMYYNYYAAQVMHHYGGSKGKAWEKQMRAYLVSRQSQQGHEQGSWYFGDGADHGAARGGRLYTTSMAAMILEVDYSKAPIYGSAAVDVNFPTE